MAYYASRSQQTLSHMTHLRIWILLGGTHRPNHDDLKDFFGHKCIWIVYLLFSNVWASVRYRRKWQCFTLALSWTLAKYSTSFQMHHNLSRLCALGLPESGNSKWPVWIWAELLTSAQNQCWGRLSVSNTANKSQTLGQRQGISLIGDSWQEHI